MVPGIAAQRFLSFFRATKIGWKSTLIVSVLSTSSVTGYSEPNAGGDGEFEAQIDALFSDIGPGSPGVSVALVKNGNVVFKKSYGLADIGHGIPITSRTVFDTASLAKQFTGFAIAKLATYRLLSLEDNPRKYIPELPDWADTVSIAQLVHHTAGIPDWPYVFQVGGVRLRDDEIGVDDILRYVYGQEATDFEPGSRMAYSNAGYSLLAEIVARLSDRTFPEWMSENVFAPLEMDDTLVRASHRQVIANLARPYFIEGDNVTTPANQLTAFGSSSVFSTVDDLLAWVDLFDSGRLEMQGVLELMRTPGRLNDGSATNYAYGLGVLRHRGLDFIAHNGEWLGYSSTLQRYPEHKAAVIVLSNSSRHDASALGSKLAGLLMADSFHEPAPPTEQEAAGAEVSEGAWSDAVLEEFTGKFALGAIPGYVITIRQENDSLLISSGDLSQVRLVRQDASRFRLADGDITVRFERAPDGSVDTLILNRGGEYAASRIEPFVVESERIDGYAGRYYSVMLDTSYFLENVDGVLTVTHPWTGSFELQPMAADRFGEGPSYFSGASFIRDDDGLVSAMRVTAEGIDGVLFERMH